MLEAQALVCGKVLMLVLLSGAPLLTHDGHLSHTHTPSTLS